MCCVCVCKQHVFYGMLFFNFCREEQYRTFEDKKNLKRI